MLTIFGLIFIFKTFVFFSVKLFKLLFGEWVFLNFCVRTVYFDRRIYMIGLYNLKCKLISDINFMAPPSCMLKFTGSFAL